MKLLITALLIALSLGAARASDRVTVTTYAPKYQGRHTSDGSVFSHRSLTAATNRKEYYHKWVQLATHRDTTRTVWVWVNDKFAASKWKLRTVKFDLTAAAMKRLGLRGKSSDVHIIDTREAGGMARTQCTAK